MPTILWISFFPAFAVKYYEIKPACKGKSRQWTVTQIVLHYCDCLDERTEMIITSIGNTHQSMHKIWIKVQRKCIYYNRVTFNKIVWWLKICGSSHLFYSFACIQFAVIPDIFSFSIYAEIKFYLVIPKSTIIIH